MIPVLAIRRMFRLKLAEQPRRRDFRNQDGHRLTSLHGRMEFGVADAFNEVYAEVSGGQRSITGVTQVDEKGRAFLDFNEDRKLLAAVTGKIWFFMTRK